MTKSGIILMTALVPTRGHKALIDFASCFLNNYSFDDGIDELHVVISARTFEPVPGILRVNSLRDVINSRKVRIHLHLDDNAPQNPSTDEEWQYWIDICHKFAGKNITKFFASETYGKTMADKLGSEFIPYDIDRTIYPVKGTKTRLMYAASDMLPAFRNLIHMNFTIFGAESCGKTTMTKKVMGYVNNMFGGFENRRRVCNMTEEFARPYLEMMDDKTVTDEKMKMIAVGQTAIEEIAAMNDDVLFTVRDTDLLSTVGYNKIYTGEVPEYIDHMFRTQFRSDYVKDLYIVMTDQIPFTPDVLRYGGDVRESNTQFWIDLLDEYEQPYYVVKATDPSEQYREVCGVVWDHIMKFYGPITNFVRD